LAHIVVSIFKLSLWRLAAQAPSTAPAVMAAENFISIFQIFSLIFRNFFIRMIAIDPEHPTMDNIALRYVDTKSNI